MERHGITEICVFLLESHVGTPTNVSNVMNCLMWWVIPWAQDTFVLPQESMSSFVTRPLVFLQHNKTCFVVPQQIHFLSEGNAPVDLPYEHSEHADFIADTHMHASTTQLNASAHIYNSGSYTQTNTSKTRVGQNGCTAPHH